MFQLFPITAPQSAPGGCLFKAHCAICVHAQKAGPLLEIGSTGVALLHAEVTSVCNGACLFTCAVAPRGFFMMHVFIVRRVLVACPGRMQGKAMRANVFRRLSFVEESLLECAHAHTHTQILIRRNAQSFFFF